MKFRVEGIPAPQGSKRPVRAGGRTTGRVVLVESSKKVGPWRDAVMGASLLARTTEFYRKEFPEGPVSLTVTFIMPRPAGHYGRGRTRALLPSAPARPAGYPDLDKLCRSTCDALVAAGVLADDAQVVELNAAKVYAADGEAPGAVVEIGACRG